MNIVKNYEESSEFTFDEQMNNVTTLEYLSRKIQMLWLSRIQIKIMKVYFGTYPSLYLVATLPSPFDCLSAVKNVTEQLRDKLVQNLH